MFDRTQATIQRLRQVIYDRYGYLGGAGHEQVARIGIQWGGEAREAGLEILRLIGKA